MQADSGNSMHMSVDSTVDNAVLEGLVREISEGVRGQVKPWPTAIDELVEVSGQPFLEVVMLRGGPDGPLDGGRAVHAERHRPDLPGIALRSVVPALDDADLPGAGIAGNGLPVRPLPLRAARVRSCPRALPVRCLERVQDQRPLV